MGVPEILAEIDLKIAQLQEARAILSESGGRATVKTTEASAVKPAKKKRNLSAEGRKRIAESVKRRWAKQKR